MACWKARDRLLVATAAHHLKFSAKHQSGICLRQPNFVSIG